MKDLEKPLWQLTVGEFLELCSGVAPQPVIIEKDQLPKYVYGLDGLAKILRCSKTHACNLKATGMFDEAIKQNGRKIVVDTKKALELFKNTENNDRRKNKNKRADT